MKERGKRRKWGTNGGNRGTGRPRKDHQHGKVAFHKKVRYFQKLFPRAFFQSYFSKAILTRLFATCLQGVCSVALFSIDKVGCSVYTPNIVLQKMFKKYYAVPRRNNAK